MRFLRRQPKGRWAAGAGAIFVVGVGVGMGLGLWLSDSRERPQTSLAIPERPDFEERRYDLPVTVYRSERALDTVTYEEADPPEPPDDVRSRTAAVPRATPPVTSTTAGPSPVPLVPERLAAVPDGSPDTAASIPPRPAGQATAEEEAPQPERLARLTPEQTGQPEALVRSPAEPLWRKRAVPVMRDDGKPMIAVVIDDMGIDQPRTRRAIALKGQLTLAFIPYGYNLSEHVRDARARGHEIMVHLPMEPMNPDVDPGPNALLTSLTPGELDRRLEWALSQFGDYVGVNNHMGSRFTAWPDGMRQLLASLKRRGLLFMDSITTRDRVGYRMAEAMGMPHTTRDVFLDHDQRPEAVARQLRQTEQVARSQGAAVAIGHPHDATLTVLEEWLETVERRGFQLVPITAIVGQAYPQG